MPRSECTAIIPRAAMKFISQSNSTPAEGWQDIKFTGRGCAISQASASLMTMKLKGKSRKEAMEMLHAFHDLVTNDAGDASNALGDLRVMKGVRNFPQRVKCAMLPWRAVEQAFEQGAGEATVSTEPT